MTPPQKMIEKITETKEKILEVLHKKKTASKASLSKISNFVKQAIVELRKEGKIFVEKNNIILVEKDEKEENMRKKENVSKTETTQKPFESLESFAKNYAKPDQESKRTCNTCKRYALNENVRIPPKERTDEQRNQLEFEGLEDCGCFPKDCKDYIPHAELNEKLYDSEELKEIEERELEAFDSLEEEQKKFSFLLTKPDPAKQSGHGMVEIASIKVGDRMRSLNQEEVARLAESIKEIDLLNPIVVDSELNLIAGYHRLEACKLLGWTKIKATISNLGSLEKELAEIDENLIRNELSAFERSEHLGKRKEIYEKLHPETKVGQSQAIAMNQKLGYNVDEIISSTLTPTFTEDTSKKLGVTQRTVQQEISIAKNLSPEAKDFVINNGLANKKTALLEIAKAAPEKQIEIAQKLASGSTVKAIKEQSTAAQELKKKKGELEAEILKLRGELYKVQCEKARLEKDVAYWKQQADEMHKFLGESMKKNDQLKEQLEEKYKAQQTQDFQAAQGWESPAQVEQVEPEEDLVPPEGVHRPPMEGSNFMPEESYKDEDDDYDYKDN